MADTRVIGLDVSLGDDPADIETHHWASADGTEYASLRLGNALSLYLARTSPEVLRKLAAAATELADWREQQDAGSES